MDKIEKIILRNRLYKPSEISINIETLMAESKVDNLKEYIKINGFKRVMKDIYLEDLDLKKLEESALFREFNQSYNSYKDNSSFQVAYKIRNDIAIRITDHIYVCRIADDTTPNAERAIPWYCKESEVYIADSWWEEDKDIIKDFQTMTYIDFIVKYKMY